MRFRPLGLDAQANRFPGVWARIGHRFFPLSFTLRPCVMTSASNRTAAVREVDSNTNKTSLSIKAPFSTQGRWSIASFGSYPARATSILSLRQSGQPGRPKALGTAPKAPRPERTSNRACLSLCED
jgi:hypothetical protein